LLLPGHSRLQIHGSIPFVSAAWAASGPPVAAPTSFSELEAAAATAGWSYSADQAAWDPAVSPKPWNPITRLAYRVGAPLMRTYFSSNKTFDSTGAVQNDQGDALFAEVNAHLKACRQANANDLTFADMLATVYDGVAKTCGSTEIAAGRTAASLLATPLFAFRVRNFPLFAFSRGSSDCDTVSHIFG
jgi:hypothetical protein